MEHACGGEQLGRIAVAVEWALWFRKTGFRSACTFRPEFSQRAEMFRFRQRTVLPESIHYRVGGDGTSAYLVRQVWGWIGGIIDEIAVLPDRMSHHAGTFVAQLLPPWDVRCPCLLIEAVG